MTRFTRFLIGSVAFIFRHCGKSVGKVKQFAFASLLNIAQTIAPRRLICHPCKMQTADLLRFRKPLLCPTELPGCTCRFLCACIGDLHSTQCFQAPNQTRPPKTCRQYTPHEKHKTTQETGKSVGKMWERIARRRRLPLMRARVLLIRRVRISCQQLAITGNEWHGRHGWMHSVFGQRSHEVARNPYFTGVFRT